MLTAEWSWEFAVARERLWPYLADTDWVNRHAGLPRIEARYEALPEGGARRIAWFRKGPVLIEWEERPTQWRVPEFFAVERLYTSGPLRRFANATALVALDTARTRVDVRVELEATSPVFARLLPLVARQGRRGAQRAFTLAARLAGGATFEGAGEATAQARFAALRGIDRRVAAALASHVSSADARELARMQPYALADRWNLARREVLRGCLAATRAGLFNLQWSVLCPSCRGGSPPVASLAGLRADQHCAACNLPFDAVFDRSVEVTFSAAPVRRDAGRPPLYCIANPHGSAHVLAQVTAESGGSVDFQLDLARGHYRVHCIGSPSVPFAALDDEPDARLSVVYGDSATPPAAAVRAGIVEVAIANRHAFAHTVRIESATWPDTLLTAAQVTALQEFRDLFSSEVLAAGVEVGVESVAVLFSDLIGSTAMYATTGDAAAFRIVSDHFRRIREIVDQHDGAIVKTIGDAVMATFPDAVSALEAALKLDGAVADLDCIAAPLRLRVGLHAGPCIAMNANDRIDYFGTSVNLAARMQALAGAGEVVLTQELAQRPAVNARLRAAGLEVVNESQRVRGFAQAIPVARVRAR